MYNSATVKTTVSGKDETECYSLVSWHECYHLIIIIVIIIIIIIIIIIMIIIIITTIKIIAIVVVVVVVVKFIMIIGLKGASRDFCHLLTARRTVSNTYPPVARVQLCANHVQHIERLSRATCRVPRGTKGQLRY